MKVQSIEIQFRDILTEGDGQSIVFSADTLDCRKVHYKEEEDAHAVYIYNKRTWKDYPVWMWAESYKYHKDIVKDVLVVREYGGKK